MALPAPASGEGGEGGRSGWRVMQVMHPRKVHFLRLGVQSDTQD